MQMLVKKSKREQEKTKVGKKRWAENEMKIVWVFELKTFPLSFVSLLLFGSLVRSECVWVYVRVSVLTKKRVSDWQCVVWWPTKVSNLTLDVPIRLPWVKTMSSPSPSPSLSILVMEWWAFHWFWFHYYYFDVNWGRGIFLRRSSLGETDKTMF